MDEIFAGSEPGGGTFVGGLRIQQSSLISV